MKKEKDISNSIIKVINQKYSSTTFLYKRLSGKQQIGMPDITGCCCGRRVEIEVKKPDKLHTLSAHQAYWIDKFKRLGCVSGVVSSLDEALKLLELE